MNPRVSGCSFIYPSLSLDEGIRRAAKFGFRTVDVGVGGVNGHISPLAAAREPGPCADEVRRAAGHYGVTLNECFTLHFGPPVNDPDPAVRGETRRRFDGLARFAAAAGFRSILLLPGPVHPALGEQRSLDLAVEALGPLSETAAGHGLRLNVETDCDSCAARPEAAEELCERVPGIRLTLDYSHFISRGCAQGEVERLHRHAGHFHVRQAAPGRIVASVEKGTIDYARVLEDLGRRGYAGSFTVEYLHFPELARWGIDVEEETRRMAAVLNGLLGGAP